MGTPSQAAGGANGANPTTPLGTDARAAADPTKGASAALVPTGERRPLPAGLPEGRVLTVLHAANLRGEYESHPLGGLARRATFAAETAKALKANGGGMIHVDIGDAFLPLSLPGGADEPAPDKGEVLRRARLIAAGLGRLHLDAFVPGESDLSLGWKEFRALALSAKLPVLLANVVDAKGKHPFESSRLITTGGIRVGVFGVLDLAEDKRGSLKEAGLVLGDPAATAQGSASELRHNGAEIVIGLVHLQGGIAAATAMAKSIGGVDAFVVGHEGKMLEDPLIVTPPGAEPGSGDVMVVEAGQRGRFLGRLDFHIGAFIAGFAVPRAGGSLKADGGWLDHQLVRLNEQVLSDPAMTALIAPYRAMNRQRAARRLPVGLTARAGTKGDLADTSQELWTYGTTDGCRLCHAEETAQWATTSHAFSLQTLERKARNRDPDCMACHITAFDGPGGTRNLETANRFFGPIGCESCHGPGVKHVRSRKPEDIVLKVPESVCVACHKNEHSPDPFDYPSTLKAVLGPGHGP